MVAGLQSASASGKPILLRVQLGPDRPGLRRLLKMAHARWRIEMDYRELKEELGLDHFEGRHWLGRHHHVTLVTVAYAFLRSEQARLKKRLLVRACRKCGGACSDF